jgi:preprotein translocase subunit SecB
MNEKTESKNVDLGAAIVVSDRVSIKDVRLISCNCLQTPSAVTGKHFLNIDCDVKTHVDNNKCFILVFPTFKLQAFASERKRKKPDLVIEGTFVVTYKAETLKGVTQNNLEAFSNANGVYNAWPYWREFVQNMVARMNLPPLTIPVFRLFTPRVEGKTKKKTIKENDNKQSFH